MTYLPQLSYISYIPYPLTNTPRRLDESAELR